MREEGERSKSQHERHTPLQDVSHMRNILKGLQGGGDFRGSGHLCEIEGEMEMGKEIF